MPEYPLVNVESAAAELNRLHLEIEGKLRATVADAIRAGEILAKIKESLPHGDFTPWVKANCRFSDRTARQYIQVFEYRDKTATLADLQTAYSQIETIEAQAKRSEEENARRRVKEYLKTGKKPEGWRRGTDDKLAEEERAMKARAEKFKAEIAEDAKNRAQAAPRVGPGDVKKIMDELTESIAERQTFKERIRVSHEGQDDPFVDAIMDYLETLEDDNRRIEACSNIIKVCRGIANQLHGRIA